MHERIDVKVLVVGGGISGLAVAQNLKDRATYAIVLEANAKAGGRLRQCKTPLRIPFDHRRTLQRAPVCAESALSELPPVFHPEASSAGLSIWDTVALSRRNPLSADHNDLMGTAQSSMSTASIAPPSTASHMLVNVSDLVDDMSNNITIACNTRVVDIRRTPTVYVVQCRCQLDDKMFVNRIYLATTLFLCVPPQHAERWTIMSQWARAHMAAVQSHPLNYIYGAMNAPTRFHVRTSDTLFGRSSSETTVKTMLLSETGGRLADFWNRLRLSSHAHFLKVLMEEARRILHLVLNPSTVESAYCDIGYHTWRPTPFFVLGKAVAKSLMPNARHLPNVFWCGESHSSYQGYVEGCFETADAAVNLFHNPSSYILPQRHASENELIIEGRIIDMSEWCDMHPGGASMLKHLAGQNATDHFYHSQHSRSGWAMLYSLQVA